MTRLDRRALFATGSAAALLAAVGVSAQAAPVRGGHLRVALSGGDRSETWLDVPGGRFLQAARNAVFETLTEIAPDGTLRSGLATEWSASADGREWTFHLAQDVKFHDGKQLTAADVVESLTRPGVDLTVIETAPHAVKILLDAENAALPFDLATGQCAIFAASELNAGVPPTLGTGLYRIRRFDPGRGFLGERVANHRNDGASGWFDTVELVSLSDERVRAEAVRDGFVDAADISDAYDLADRNDVDLLMDGDHVQGAIRSGIARSSRLGPHPLDALRFSARWWMQA